MGRRLLALGAGLFVLVLLTAEPSGQAGTVVSQETRATIIGSVVDGSLAPLPGVAVTLRTSFGRREGRVQATTTTDASGAFRFTAVAPGDYRVRAERAGFPAFVRDLRVPAGATTLRLPIVLARADQDLKQPDPTTPPAQTSTVAPPPPPPARPTAPPTAGAGGGRGGRSDSMGTVAMLPGVNTQSREVYIPEPAVPGYGAPASGENYAHVDANRFQLVADRPLSTFGADVDTASYTNVRRFLSGGQLPPRDAVRVEEFVNYFRFGYAEPRGSRPIALTTEVGDCPWAPSHKLVLIGARAKASAGRQIEGRNLVLLLDVSGSMAPPERLPLIKTALRMFVDTLAPDDRLAIVTYAGSSGVALPSTPARRRDVIQSAIANLSAGGSTNGGSGLVTAYRVARQAYIPGGINRVILATDGDFNVGVVDQRDLVRIVTREKDSGIFLSVFGVGSGNLKDSTMEMLADKGNGHYSYLDTFQEARRVLLREADATLETVAKDVKFQVEFNPATVSAWKLIGYENRVMAAQDFNNDRKDGGEMGAGHTVTVLYEVVPVGVERSDDHSGEWLTVKVRYKAPEGEASELMTHSVRSEGRVQHLPLASAVAEFGLLLRRGTQDGERWDALERRVAALRVPAAQAADKDGFAELVAIARGLARLR